jgi:hypothetical protein
MIKKIFKKKKLIALIIFKKFTCKDIKFFTPENSPQQIGYMNRPKDYVVKPHKHLKVSRNIRQVQEVLFIKKGKIQVELFCNKGIFISKHILNTGDIIFLSSGCHGLKMLKQTEIIEVKQGPYNKKKDKIFID